MWQVVLLVAYGLGLWLVDRSQQNALLARRPDRRQDWEDAVERCGLWITGGPPKPYPMKLYPRFTARVEPFEVRVETFGPEEEETRIEVRLLVAPEFADVRIRQASRTAGDVTVGDPGFDNAFALEGPELNLLALLDSNTRRHMRAVSAVGRLEIAPGRIEAVISRDGLVSEILPSLLDIAERLGTPIDLQRSLIENVKQDSEGGVRLQNLLLLLRESPGDPAAVEALRAACLDRSPAIRMRAAKELGAEGRDTLLQIARGLEDDALSAEAVSILDRELPVEHTKTLLDRAWSTGRLQTAHACLEVLVRHGAAAVGALSEMLTLRNIELASAAAKALEEIAGPAAESALIRALQHEEDDIQVAAAKALGRVGSTAAVLPLQEAIERSRLNLEVRAAAQHAIARIQSRVQGASPGQLSLATEGGQLSLSHDPAGQLSLDETET